MDGELARGMRKAGRKILFDRDSPCLQELLRLLGVSGHRAQVAWALDCAEQALAVLEAQWPGEARPRAALQKCGAWARGEIKMPEAKRAILDAHAAAREAANPRLAALAHAVGQAGATVHVGTHAPGLAFSELTAIRLGAGPAWEQAVAEKIGFYLERLAFWRDRADDPERAWASFLSDRKR